MNRTRHILTALVAGLPILVAALTTNFVWGSASGWMLIFLWLATAGALVSIRPAAPDRIRGPRGPTA